MGAIAIVDAFWGDGGKGVRSAWEALLSDAKMVLRGCGGSGAEHGTYIDNIYLKTNQLPLGFILKGCLIGLGPGTAVDPVKLFEEIKRFHLRPEDLRIDYRCPIITLDNIEREKGSANMIKNGGTLSGTGMCMSDAALRISPHAEDIKELSPYLDDIPSIVNKICEEGRNVVLESSQGFGLSRYFGEKNYVTSVDVTTGSLISGTGLNWQYLDKVILVVKALPTREGAGPMGNVEEFSIPEMRKLEICEYSSIPDPMTGEPQIRRKAKGIDWDMLKRAVMITGATEITLTFAEHYDPDIKNKTKPIDLTYETLELISKIEDETMTPVTMVNTGKDISAMIWLDHKMPKLSRSIMKRLQSYRS